MSMLNTQRFEKCWKTKKRKTQRPINPQTNKQANKQRNLKRNQRLEEMLYSTWNSLANFTEFAGAVSPG